jgi:hypothetical protein
MNAGLLLAAALSLAEPPADLLTVAESSGWQATATHAEVVALLERLRDRSPLLRLAEMGRTVEGRSIPIAVLADPPLASAAEARASGRAIVFAFGDIHAGEVCGKEALLMLAREIILDPAHPLLRDLVLVFAPIYNGDGNDRMSPDNRPGQNGPALGMGTRANAQGLDLNRDWVKLEAPESRAMVRFLTEWDPHVTIDTHTTNGTRHRYVLTYDAPRNPSGRPEPVAFLRDELFPAVTLAMRDLGWETFYYGDLNAERTAWQTYGAAARYGSNYQGLRGQISILSEGYSYAPYRDRVLATREFVRAIAVYAAAHRARIMQIAADAARRTTEAGLDPQPSDTVGIRHRPAAFPDLVTLKACREGTDEPEDLRVIHLGRFEAVLSVRRPWAYLLEPGLDRVAENLRQHGIRVEPFTGEALVESYSITAVTRAEQPFQGHHLVDLEAHASLARRAFPAGSLLVPTGQPLGTLAVYLLEPQSEDGLAAWNFLDDRLAVGATYPVFRVRAAGDLQ